MTADVVVRRSPPVWVEASPLVRWRRAPHSLPLMLALSADSWFDAKDLA